ncbi:MAG TPA: tetratricopeptide repeat protein [Pirellulales bacterium]|nr:tetratricopeptide repeat protein [Pirellulales bacterium]
MKKRSILITSPSSLIHRPILVGVVLLAAHQAARADDQIKKTSGDVVRGTIVALGKDEVKFEKSGKQDTIPTYEIQSIRIDEEPPQLNLIRNKVSSGAYENALKDLDKIEADSVSKADVKQDIVWLKAYCHAQLALGGGGDLADAGRQLKAFIDANGNSYHYYPANELAGDLASALGKYEAATRFYKTLADSPLPGYKIRSSVDVGRAKLAEKKFPEALKEFETALGLVDKSGDAGESQKLAAMLGKAACLGETGQPQDGVKLAEEVIGKLPNPEEENELHARAYVTLGNCLRKLDQTKPALLAFLHVDLLYFANPQTHAEALWNLAALQQQLGKLDRATQAAQLLKERYPNSPWAKM